MSISELILGAFFIVGFSVIFIVIIYVLYELYTSSEFFRGE